MHTTKSYTRIILQKAVLPSGLKSAVLSAVVEAANPPDGQRPALTRVGAEVLGPTVVSFLAACFDSAIRHGIRRLYFVARDGQVLHAVARVLCERWNIDLDVRYLYGSRQAWHPASLHDTTLATASWLSELTDGLTLGRWLARVNLPFAALEPYLASDALRSENAVLDRAAIAHLCNLVTATEFGKKVLARSAELRREATCYFRQEGLADGVPYAIVDIGWHGRLQASLSHILTLSDLYPSRGVTGMYFHLESGAAAVNRDNLIAFFVDGPGHCVRRNICKNKSLLEALFAADHGTTLGYRQCIDGRWTPILKESGPFDVNGWGVGSQHAAAVRFADAFSALVKFEYAEPNALLDLAEFLLNAFTSRPLLMDAQVYGRYQLSSDQSDECLLPLAPSYSLAQSTRLLLLGEEIHRNVWSGGSERVSRPLPRLLCRIGRSRIARAIRWRVSLG